MEIASDSRPPVNGRYDVVRELGRGGSAAVFAARDRWLGGRAVALKILQGGGLEHEQRLRREFALLFRLRHANVCRVFELGRVMAAGGESIPEGALYLAEELCVGVPAHRWAQGRSVADVAWVGAQAAAALAALHGLNIRHGDVTPANVLVVDEGASARAVLIDFGLAGRGAGHGVSGTLRFMAPEALAGRPTLASDVYGLAATLAAMLGVDAAHREPGAPIQAPALGDVLTAMSAPEPDRRADAATAFTSLLEHVPSPARRELERLRDASATPATVVGRASLEQAIEEVLTSSSPGARALRLCGPAGIGKTAALEEAVARAVLHGYTVPGGVRVASDGGLEHVERLLAELGSGETSAQREPRGDDPHSVRWRRFARIAERLASVSEGQSLALAFDDVPPGSPLDELGCFLTRLGDAGPRLSWLQAGPPGDGRRDASMLAPLDEEATAAFIIAARPLRPTDARAAAALQRASGGNPALAQGLLVQFPGDELLRAATAGELEAGAATRDAVQRLVDTLAPEHRDLVAAVAWFSGAVPLALLRGVDRLRGALEPEQLDRAVGHGLVTTRRLSAGLGLALASEASRPALRACAEPALLRTIAEEIEAVAAAELPADLGSLWLELGEPDRAAPLLLAGARTAADGLHFAEALRLYEAVLGLPASGGEARRGALAESARALLALGRAREAQERFAAAHGHAEQRIGQAEAWIALGRYVDAAAVLEGAPAPDEDQAWAEALAARANMLAGRYDDAERCVSGALARGPEHPRAVELQNVLGVVAFFRGDLPRARATLEAAHAAASARGERRLVDATQSNLAMVLQKMGDFAAAERAYEASLHDLRRLRDLPRQLLRLTNLAVLRQEMGQFHGAFKTYEEAAAMARLIDGRRPAVRIHTNWANLLAWLGQTERALDLCERALADAAELGMAVEQAYLWLVRAEIAVSLGDAQRAEELVAQARAAFSQSCNRAGVAECSSVSAQLSVRRGAYTEALGAAREAVDQARALGRERIEAHAILWLGLAALGAARVTRELVGEAERLASIAERWTDPDLRWLAHALLAAMHRALSDGAAAERHAAIAHRAAAAAQLLLPPRADQAYRAAWFRTLLATPTPRGKSSMNDVTRDFDRLLAINRELAQDHDPERLLERIIDAAIALSGAERGFLLLRPEGAGTSDAELQVQTARRHDRQGLAEGDLHISRSIANEVIATNAPVTTLNAQDDERFREFRSVHNLKLRSVLCLPLRAQNVAGALYLDNRYRVSAFSDADVMLLSAFGDQAAIALANARLVSELERRTRELERSRAEIEELNERLQRELAARSAELEAARALRGGLEHGETKRHGMVGRSAAMRDVFRIIERVADKDVPVTVLGESGTGKELAARAIHAASSRRQGPFVALNCGAIPAQLLESELFGHEKGAFTGAVRGKPGLFEIARGGTMFLDEIGDMPQPMQVKLLRVLQTGEFRRVGGTSDLTSDARVVSATNRDLEAMVRDGSFREDLWYRLNVVEVRLPPLRQRREDLPLLIEHLLELHGRGQRIEIDRRALAALLDHDWPGNVRELENEIQRAVALSDGTIELDSLSPKIHERMRPQVPGRSSGALRDIIERYERDTIRAVLEEHDGRVAAAAESLGLTRAGLYKKLHKYNLNVDKS